MMECCSKIRRRQLVPGEKADQYKFCFTTVIPCDSDEYEGTFAQDNLDQFRDWEFDIEVTHNRFDSVIKAFANNTSSTKCQLEFSQRVTMDFFGLKSLSDGEIVRNFCDKIIDEVKEISTRYEEYVTDLVIRELAEV